MGSLHRAHLTAGFPSELSPRLTHGVLFPLCHLQEKYVEELGAVRQTLQADLETSIRRIADLQAALEDVVSSDSEAER